MAARPPTRMRAVLLTGHGGFDRLEYRDDVPVPTVEEGEVLVEVAAAGVNNTDVNTRIGWYSKDVRDATSAGAGEGFCRRSERRLGLDRIGNLVPADPGRGLLRPNRRRGHRRRRVSNRRARARPVAHALSGSAAPRLHHPRVGARRGVRRIPDSSRRRGLRGPLPSGPTRSSRRSRAPIRPRRTCSSEPVSRTATAFS